MKVGKRQERKRDYNLGYPCPSSGGKRSSALGERTAAVDSAGVGCGGWVGSGEPLGWVEACGWWLSGSVGGCECGCGSVSRWELMVVVAVLGGRRGGGRAGKACLLAACKVCRPHVQAGARPARVLIPDAVAHVDRLAEARQRRLQGLVDVPVGGGRLQCGCHAADGGSLRGGQGEARSLGAKH